MRTRSTSLATVRKFFPDVKLVKDSRKSVVVHVTKRDETTSRKRDYNECAMAIACKREFKARGIIMARSIAYVIKGKMAIRYQVPPTVAREITSFDRGAGFEPGTYSLCKITNWVKRTKGGHRPDTGKGQPITYRHTTANIRAVLRGKEV